MCMNTWSLTDVTPWESCKTFRRKKNLAEESTSLGEGFGPLAVLDVFLSLDAM